MSTQQKQSTLVASHISSLPPAKLLDDEKVANKFVELYNKVNGSARGELVQHQQAFHYKKLLAEKLELRECTPLSLYGVVLDIAVNDLSLEAGKQPDCYITFRSFNVGTNDKPVWEKRAQLAISPYGELKMRMRAGQIKYADNPVIVYDGDKFAVGTTEKGKTVTHEAVFPRGTKIIASYIRLVRLDGSVDFHVIDQNEIERLKVYSNKQNKGDATNNKANALYTSVNGGIDPGFLAAKTIKHAFRTYPKVPTGKFSELEPEDGPLKPGEVDYGFDADQASANAVQDIPHEDITQKDDFDAALQDHAQTNSEPTVSFNDEPEF